METARIKMNAEPRRFDYNVGALAVLFISIGLAAIVYGIGILRFDIVNLLAWIFGPLGIYTLVYSIIAHIESVYYMVWGTIMIAIAIVTGFYNIVPLFLVLGLAIIVLAVIGVVAYMRSRK